MRELNCGRCVDVHIRQTTQKVVQPDNGWFVLEMPMKTLMASIFALVLLGTGAADAQGVGAHVDVLGVGVGAHVGNHGVGAGAHVGPVGAGGGVGDHGVGAGANVGSASAGVGIHGRRCSDWGYRDNRRYCRHYRS